MRFTKHSILQMAMLVLIGAALFYVLRYIILAFQRLPYQFEIQILEGAMLDQVRRVIEGQALYVKPSLEFVPFHYPPLFFYVAAAVAKIAGLNFFSLRLVSFAASIGCFLIIYLFVKKETKSAFAGIVATGIFAATYHLSNDWFDIGRVDMLFLFFLLLSIYFLRFNTSWKFQVAAGVFATLSFLTKQTALLAFVPLILASIVLHKRKSVTFITTLVALTTASIILLNITSNGWFTYYLLLAAKQPFLEFFNLTSLFNQPYFFLLPVAWGALIYYVYKHAVVRRELKGFFYLFLVLAFLIPAWISKVHSASELNVLLPMYAILSLFAGITIAEFPARVQKRNRKLLFKTIGVYLLFFSQFALLYYDTTNLIPSEDNLRVGKETLELVASIPGDVFIPAHNYMLVLVGKRTHANGWAMNDIFRARDHPAAEQLKKEFADAIKGQKFDAIIFDDVPIDHTKTLLRPYYVEQEKLFVNETGFITVSGVRSRPVSLFVPKRE